ncbi:MAG: permease [Planctomycetaceae bacterium]|nr:permease [Planctomycetaceae bacterium]
MEAILWGGLLRFGQAALASAPTLLVGLFVAGVFRRLLGPEATLRAFGGNTWRSLPQAWLWGMLLPVCSLGVIPVAYELRRSGLSGGAILAFAVTAPLFNPLSLLYGLTLSAPIVILAFSLCSLLVVTVVGFAWDRLFPDTAVILPPPPTVPPGPKRLASIAVTAAQYMAGPTLIYCIIGLAGNFLLAIIFPHASLTDSMGHNDPTSPLWMLLVAIPAYATPLNVMMQVGSMFVHGNSVGAAFVLLTLGAGVNLGLIAWAARTYGTGRALAFLVIFAATVLVIAYALEQPLYSAGDVERPHTHAFDVYSCPFAASHSGLATRAWQLLAAGAQAYEILALAGVVALLCSGIVLRRKDPSGRIESYLTSDRQDSIRPSSSILHANVPGPVLGAVGILGLVALSIVGCFIFYPPPDQTLEDMTMAKVDVLSAALSKDAESTAKSIQAYDDLTRRLQVGYYLRYWGLDEYQRTKAKLLRGRLEQLKDAVEAGDFQRVPALSSRISDAHRRCQESFVQTDAGDR